MNKSVFGGVLIGVLGLTLGSAVGAASVEPEVEVQRVTVTKRVEVTPQACATALDLADEGFAKSAAVLIISGKALDSSISLTRAILDMDYAAIPGITSEVADLNEQMDEITLDPEPYNRAKVECRAAV